MDKHQTLTYYQEHGQEFIERTQNIDFGFLQKNFLNYVPTFARILDFGCGSGRDALFFASQGYDVTALDATPFLLSVYKPWESKRAVYSLKSFKMKKRGKAFGLVLASCISPI